VIEHDVPDVPDRQVQLADGVPDFARGPAMAIEQPQRRFQRQPRREDPADRDIVQGPATRSRSCARRRVISTGSPALPGGGSCASRPDGGKHQAGHGPGLKCRTYRWPGTLVLTLPDAECLRCKCPRTHGPRTHGPA